VARRKGSRNREAMPQRAWSVDEVVALATRHNLAELEVESGGTRIRVVREHAAVTVARPVEGRPATDDIRAAASDLATVEAPMVGTFHRASAPDAAPFVNEGDIIKEGQVLCIIEAMKLMNEIEARVAGRIEKIVVENGQPVEYGQPLFLVSPRR
jgi:biotin carboxyl carrier protein